MAIISGTSHPGDHGPVIALQAMQIRCGTSFTCMEHSTADARIIKTLPLEVMGNGWGSGWTGAHWICPMWHCILWWMRVHNRHLRISRRMVPPQASHCNFCLWYAIYWHNQSSTSFTYETGLRLQSTRDTTAFLVDPSGTTSTEKVCADTLETHGTSPGLCWTSEAYRFPA